MKSRKRKTAAATPRPPDHQLPLKKMSADHSFNPARGRAIRVMAQLHKQAQKRNAIVELDADDDLKIHRLVWKLGQLLDEGRHVSIVPVISFEEGGLFHPSNLKIARSNPREDNHPPAPEGVS